MLKNTYTLFITGLCIFASTYNANAQPGSDVFAYPDAGQSVEQVGKDKLYCHNWAVIETGYRKVYALRISSLNYTIQ